MDRHTVPDQELMSFADLMERLKVFVRAAWQGRHTIIKIIVLGFAFGILHAFGVGEEFTATTRIIPYRSGGGSGNGLSSLAGLAGVRLPASAGDVTITADLYPEVTKSQDFRIDVAETPIYFSGLSREATSVEFFQDLRKKPLLEVIAGHALRLPEKFAGKRLSTDSKPQARKSPKDPSTAIMEYDPQYLVLVNKLTDRISVTADKKTSIITIRGTMPDPYAAADIVNVISKKLMERIIDYESKKASEQFRFANEQFEVARAKYQSVQNQIADFRNRNRSVMAASLEVERERLQREHDLAFELYQQFSREREQARIKMNQDTPAFTILEKIAVPTSRSEPRRTIIVAAWLFASFVVSFATLSLRGIAMGSLIKTGG
jgi:hypothetical protein